MSLSERERKVFDVVDELECAESGVGFFEVVLNVDLDVQSFRLEEVVDEVVFGLVEKGFLKMPRFGVFRVNRYY